MTIITSEEGEGSTHPPHQQQYNRDNRRDETANRYGNDDPLTLHMSDHSALVLVAELLDEKNYITWSRNMMIALDTRDKLRFLNGEVPEPAAGSPSYRQWHKVNSMLISWILNSMTKKIARGFMFTTKACNLWKTVKERFGESDGSVENQLKRDLINLKQGSNSVSVYFHELSGLWDEYDTLRPKRSCDCCHCGVMQSIHIQEERDKLHQFIIGLNAEYASVCNQILVMEPLPSVERAFSMISKAEKQNMVHEESHDYQKNSAMVADSAMAARSFKFQKSSYGGSRDNVKPTYGAREGSSPYGNQRDGDTSYARDGLFRRLVRRPDLKCDHCGEIGHLKDGCFKLHGYPDWWQGSRNPNVRNKMLGSQMAHAATSQQQDSPLDSTGNLQEMVLNLQMQMERLMKGKMEGVQQSENTNFAYFHDFSGPQD